jgi:hypothetical protein
MIDDKNTQIRIIFIMNHKNTINIMYLVRCCGGEQTFRKNIQHDTLPPCHVAHDEFSRNCTLSGREAARHCNGAIFHEISKDTISKIKHAALFQNLIKLG